MPDPTQNNIDASAKRSFSADPALFARRSSASDSLNLADASDTIATNQPTFHDLLQTLNPLQHIPGVSWIYRELTGDEISPQARIAGDGLFGGVLGLVSGMVNAMLEKGTGKDVGAHIMAMFDSKPADAQPTATAQATPATTPTLAANAPVAANAPAVADAKPASDPSQALTAAPTPTATATAAAALAIDPPKPAATPSTPTLAAYAPESPVPLTFNRNLPGARPVLAPRGGGTGTPPSGMGLSDYRRWPTQPATSVPYVAPPLGAATQSPTVAPAQAAAKYGEALDLSKQLESYYQTPPP
jgi:hypothetical protein